MKTGESMASILARRDVERGLCAPEDVNRGGFNTGTEKGYFANIDAQKIAALREKQRAAVSAAATEVLKG